MFNVGQKVKINSQYHRGKTGVVKLLPTASTAFYYVDLDNNDSAWFTEKELQNNYEVELIGGAGQYTIWSDWKDEQMKHDPQCTCGAWVTYGRDCDDSYHNPDYCDLKVMKV